MTRPRHAGKPRLKRGVLSDSRAGVTTNVPAVRASVSSRRKRRSGATMTLDSQSLTSLSDDARQAVTAAFDALAHWRNEISAANERSLTNVLDRVTDAHRALGWPDQVTAAAKEHFLRGSKMPAHMIDQAMDAWQQLLKSHTVRSGVPGFTFQAPVASQFTIPASEMMRFSEMTLAPFKLWMDVAEAWQRTWMAAMSGGAFPGPSSMTIAPSSQGLEASTRESRPSRS